jgi:hypothetical protein
VSDDPTQGYRRPPREPGGGPSPAVLASAAGLVILLIALLAIVWLRDRPDPLVRPPDETPTPQVTPTPDETPTPTPTPTPTHTPTPTPTPDETPEPEDREPTDADAASFAARYRPPNAEDLQSITADINADGRNEVVFVSRQEGRSRVDVAVWTGRHYEAVFADRGGDADDIERFHVHDFTGTGTREIVIIQTAENDRESLSIWGWDGEQVARQRAVGGCWSGLHTYGVIGASITEQQIRATCDAAPLPRPAWPTHIYVWDGLAWRFDRAEP